MGHLFSCSILLSDVGVLLLKPGHPALVPGLIGIAGPAVPVELAWTMELPLVPACLPDPGVSEVHVWEVLFDQHMSFLKQFPGEHYVDAADLFLICLRCCLCSCSRASMVSRKLLMPCTGCRSLITAVIRSAARYLSRTL